MKTIVFPHGLSDYVHVSELNLWMRFNSQKAVFLIVYSEQKVYKQLNIVIPRFSNWLLTMLIN